MKHSKNLKVHGLIGDILRLHWYNDFFRRSKNPKIIGFLGGGLGNFEEDAILKSIAKFMEPTDYLILGVEYISDREDDELIAEYSDKKNKQFVIGPLLDLAVLSLSKINWDKSFKFKIKKNYNDVKNSKTIISEYTYKKSDIMLSYSTKYNKLSLLKYLKDKGFSIVFEIDTFDNRYGNIILKKK
ncbi:hypothetical protein AYK24_10720 [Thermoplasmatales archaeon SG8-52-4]|nr:MAG: hypothetical protein AYK24_10720 [Thermoplasmatales archaeon SG8-52-4]